MPKKSYHFAIFVCRKSNRK